MRLDEYCNIMLGDTPVCKMYLGDCLVYGGGKTGYEIHYTSTDRQIIDFYIIGLTLVSNTYENGVGIAVFEGEFTETVKHMASIMRNDDKERLETIVIFDGIEWFGDTFEGCRNLIRVRFPETTRGFLQSVFTVCEKLETLNLPSSIELFDYYNFNGSGITTINAYPAVEPELRNAHIYPPFAGLPESGTLHILQGSDYPTWRRYLPDGWTIIPDLQ